MDCRQSHWGNRRSRRHLNEKEPCCRQGQYDTLLSRDQWLSLPQILYAQKHVNEVLPRIIANARSAPGKILLVA